MRWVENGEFASDIYGAHVIFMHEMVMERCVKKLANQHVVVGMRGDNVVEVKF